MMMMEEQEELAELDVLDGVGSSIADAFAETQLHTNAREHSNPNADLTEYEQAIMRTLSEAVWAMEDGNLEQAQAKLAGCQSKPGLPTPVHCFILATQVRCDLAQGSPDAALHHANDQLNLLRKFVPGKGNPVELSTRHNLALASAHIDLGLVYYHQGEFRKARDAYGEAHALLGELRSLGGARNSAVEATRLQATLAGNMGNTWARAGRFKAALACHLEQRRLAEALPNGRGMKEELTKAILNIQSDFNSMGQYQHAAIQATSSSKHS
jgi:tetratricopeptide (TPR) repeat protein